MSLRIRRGTESQRTGVTFNSGELVWTTDLHQLWVGDGITQGGTPAVGNNIAGYGLTYNGTSHRLDVSGLTTDDITQAPGANNRWFSNTLAHDAVGPMFTGGSHTNISFQYDSGTGHINATVTLDGVGIANVQGDTTPTLGGNLDLNTHNITGLGDININGLLSVTGLGGNLDLHTHSITGTGSINIAGTVTATNYGVVHAGSVVLNQTPSQSGILIETNLGANSNIDLFTINTHHKEADVSGAVFTRSRGSLASPASLINGDGIFNFAFSGRTSDGTAGVAAAIGTEVNGTITAGVLPGKVVIYTASSAGTLTPALTLDSTQKATFGGQAKFADGTTANPSIAFTTDGGVDTGFSHPGDGIIAVSTNASEIARFDSGGLRVVGFVKVGSFNNGILPSPPEPGMIVLDTNSNQFKGYNGTSWVVLG